MWNLLPQTLASLVLLTSCVHALPPGKRSCPSVSDTALRPSYLKVAFGRPKDRVEDTAKASFDHLLGGSARGAFGNVRGWIAQNGWTVVAQYDAVHKSRIYYDAVAAAQDYLSGNSETQCGWVEPFVNCFNDDNGWAGLALLQAYETYGDEKFLNWAKGIFEFTMDHGYIQSRDLEAGRIVGGREIEETIGRTCNGNTMEGGVTWKNTGHTTINSVSTGLFALLGAKLCQHLKEPKYCEHGYRAMQWLDRHMVTPEGLLWDNIGAENCKLTNWKFTYNAGLYIAAYSLLGDLTKNETAIRLAAHTARASISTSQWNTDSGIIKEGAGAPEMNDGISFKSVLIRALHNSHGLFERSLQRDIERYINIQYYAITQLDADDARNPKTYGRNWTGPGYDPASFTPQTQMQVENLSEILYRPADIRSTALDVLNAVSALNPASRFPSADNKDAKIATIR